MDAERLLASVGDLNRLKAAVREFIPGLRLMNGMVASIEDPEERMAVIAYKWNLETALDVLRDPTSTYQDIAEAGREVSRAVRKMYALAIAWEDFDLQLAMRRLEDVSDEIGKLLFTSKLRTEFQPEGGIPG